MHRISDKTPESMRNSTQEPVTKVKLITLAIPKPSEEAIAYTYEQKKYILKNKFALDSGAIIATKILKKSISLKCFAMVSGTKITMIFSTRIFDSSSREMAQLHIMYFNV